MRAIDVNKFTVTEACTIHETIAKIEKLGKGIVFVVSDDMVFLGMFTDGDFRRVVMQGIHVEEKLKGHYNTQPYVIRPGMTKEDIHSLYKKTGHKLLRGFPVVDERHRLVDIIFPSDYIFNDFEVRYPKIAIPAVIMAGGIGSRMEPFTTILPKALLPLGDKSVIEHIIELFEKYDLPEYIISINYKGSIIKTYLNEMSYNHKISYLIEKMPMGTIGSLSLYQPQKDKFFLSNCDTIVNLNLADLTEFHEKNENSVTVVTSLQKKILKYGICKIDENGNLCSIVEKPKLSHLVNTGFYLFNSEVTKHIPNDKAFDLPDLIDVLLKLKRKIGVFPIMENNWSDLGQWLEYYKSLKNISMGGNLC